MPVQTGLVHVCWSRNHAHLTLAALGNDHFIVQVAALTHQLGEWKGTATDLRNHILYLLGRDEPGDSPVPLSPGAVRATLRRFIPALRADGIEVILDHREPGTGRRLIKLRVVDQN